MTRSSWVTGGVAVALLLVGSASPAAAAPSKFRLECDAAWGPAVLSAWASVNPAGTKLDGRVVARDVLGELADPQMEVTTRTSPDGKSVYIDFVAWADYRDGSGVLACYDGIVVGGG